MKLITRYDGLCEKWVLADERGSPCDVQLFPACPAGLVLAILDEEAVIQNHVDQYQSKLAGDYKKPV
ncbi:MAG: hypothetical protein K8L91_23905 [Anaerolineae bacterium]|nr:hypothetical protein [Anaerolineae bacterium]